MGIADRLNALTRRVPTWPLYGLGLVPAGVYFWQAITNQLGADPVRALERSLGLVALQFLIAALAVTPLRTWTGVNLLRFRRMLGLTGFFYGVMHLGVWLALDRQFLWAEIVADLTKRPYIIVGALAFAMLVPLAATSSAMAIRRMGGRAWRRLHRLAYPATAFAAIHYVWLVKAWPPKPLIYLGLVLALLSVRLVVRPKAVARAKQGRGHKTGFEGAVTKNLS